MEVQIVDKIKGAIDIIIGIEAKIQKRKTNEIYSKTTGTIQTNDLFTRKQIQKIAMDQQKRQKTSSKNVYLVLGKGHVIKLV